jgi:hypothetical protein
MVGRRQQHLRAVGENHGLQHIHGLGDVGHVHTKKLALTLEEENGYFQGFAQGKTSRVGLNPCAGLYRYITFRRTADDAKLQQMSRCTPTP